VRVDAEFIRPAEVDALLADASKAHRVLGWWPQVDFAGLVQMMVDADVAAVARTLPAGERPVRRAERRAATQAEPEREAPETAQERAA
jgi:GDPmannose 4,6-dehydratase